MGAFKITRVASIMGFLLLLAYSSAFGIAYARRAPSANMAYWMYTPQEGSVMLERIQFYGFFPLYRLFRTYIGRHNWDRRQMKDSRWGP